MSFDIPADMYFTMSALMIHDIAGVSVSGSQSEDTSTAVGHSWAREVSCSIMLKWYWLSDQSKSMHIPIVMTLMFCEVKW
jgi:hypothetical protein